MLENNNKRYSQKSTSAFKSTTASHDCFSRSAGLDLYFSIDVNIEVGSINEINTGIPGNSYGSIRDKSSVAAKGLLILGGVIDNDYTGEIIVIMTS